MMADLHPIVIPPFDYTHKAIKYTCSGEGFLKDGIPYDPHAEKLIPSKPKPGVPRSVLEQKPAAYWKTQCAFRGLNQSGNINDLQQRLKSAKVKMLPELKSAETEFNKDFKKTNKAARDDSWSSLKSVEQKAKANPKKFLTEAFPKGGTGRPANLDIVVLKLGDADRNAVNTAADAVGLQTAMADAPWTSSRKPSPDRWIIIGRTRDAVWNQMKDVERDTARSKLEFVNDKLRAPAAKKSITTQRSPTKHPTAKAAPKKNVPPHQPSADQAPYTFPSGTNRLEWDRKEIIEGRKIQTASRGGHYGAAGRSEHPKAKGFSAPVQNETKATQSTFPGGKTRSEWDKQEIIEGKKIQTASRGGHSGSAGRSAYQKVEPSSTPTKGSDNSWDVRGAYEIECPEIESQWDPQAGNPSLTLDIYLESRNGKPQLYAMFHFRVIEGIMRFEKPTPVPKSEMDSEKSKKRTWDDIHDDGDVDMNSYPDYVESRSSSHYTEKVFFLGAKDKPTARRPTWRYRWRGTETGEGEIQLGSDEAIQSITFSEKGTKVLGTFRCDFIGECRFTGLKVSDNVGERDADPEAQWSNHGEASHEYARQARW